MKTKSQIEIGAARSWIFVVLILFSATSFGVGLCGPVHGSASAPQTQQSYKSTDPKVTLHRQFSRALRDPLVEEARNLKIYDDYKMLSDLLARPLTESQITSIRQKASDIQQKQGRRLAVKFMIENTYYRKNELRPIDHPSVKAQWTVAESQHRRVFEHTENMWRQLVRKTPVRTDSSLIPLPHPLLIPGARFQEGYYWDSFFAFQALLRTGRENLVRGQIENFLFLIKNYGLVPNGNRDYYLSRSQPPLLSQMVRLYIENELKKGPLSSEIQAWIRQEVFPLVKKDYEHFWMNPKTRFDPVTGLNHHFDSLNTKRPERHSTDKEESIGKTYRDVRAEAESGKDFTDAFEGEASRYAGVMLNSILYSVEKDLAWMARLSHHSTESGRFEKAAKTRRAAMNKYMWDQQTGVFRDYHLDLRHQSPMVTADVFVPLHSGLASLEQANQTVKNLPRLERKGGLMSSEKVSGKQWDAPYGWAPHHYFAIQGLQKYGFNNEAQRLAAKWVQTVETIYQETGKIFEKVDAVRGSTPIESGGKYPTQEGFLWTNGVYIWALTDVLRVELVRQQ